MLRQICFLFILSLPLQAQSQTEAILQDFCHCDPIVHSDITKNNEIFFVRETRRSEDSDKELYFNVLKKQKDHWYLKINEVLDLSNITLSDNDLKNGFKDYFEFVKPAKNHQKMQPINLQKQDYLFSVLKLGKTGTAYNGMHEYLFIFQNSEKEYSPHLYYYNRSEYENGFTLRSATRKSDPQDPFYQFTLDFVKKNLQTKEPAYCIPEEEVFQWRAANPNLFSNLRKTESSKIEFVAHQSSQYYDQYKADFKDCEVENDRYKAYSGFKSPVFVYDKINNQSLLLFIPNGWPNGGAWGMRSYTVTQLKGHKLYLYSLGNQKSLVIDIREKTIQYKEKES